ncbi:VacJ family lipoprotein [Gallaecimonas sp. GXIMD4217]|uniref:MlaA family lipoprotein n=1 Tax=Gallaecimonas sp. GXIMD4217 TaxID=3131927 RepID=UPI00311AF8C0
MTRIMPLLALLLLGGCASKPQVLPDAEPPVLPPSSERDPLEGFNRAMWELNYEVIDPHVARPVTVAYSENVPKPIRTGLLNFANNLGEPSSAVNQFLRFEWGQAATTTGRFLINTTIGVLGLIDVAGHWGMERKETEFGEVLGYYGVAEGPYIMLPALGPTTIREEVGEWVDFLYPPLGALNFTEKALRWTIRGLDARERAMEQEGLLNQSLDPYAFVRDAYFQHVYFNTYNQAPPQPPEEELGDEDFLDEID